MEANADLTGADDGDSFYAWVAEVMNRPEEWYDSSFRMLIDYSRDFQPDMVRLDVMLDAGQPDENGVITKRCQYYVDTDIRLGKSDLRIPALGQGFEALSVRINSIHLARMLHNFADKIDEYHRERQDNER